ncbi:MAG: DUF2065 domain-containing protein [Polaromonas sp.]|nr:DUF2065 domain-containing protein [Polaromonas sp.]
MSGSSLWLALCAVLVIEGLLPILSPRGWRHLFEQMLRLGDGQIRFMGLASIVIGLAGLLLFSSWQA